MILGFPQNIHQSGRRIAQSIILHNPFHVSMYGSHSNRGKMDKTVHLAPIFSTYRTSNGSNVQFI
jgi:hypothetical protein